MRSRRAAPHGLFRDGPEVVRRLVERRRADVACGEEGWEGEGGG